MKLRRTVAALAFAVLGGGAYLALRTRPPAAPTESGGAAREVSAAGTEPDVDSAEDAREVSMPVFEVSATIVSAVDRRPVPGAEVRWWTFESSGVLTSDSAGSLALPLREVACWISAPGYQDVLCFEQLSQAVTIALPAAAGLEIEFSSEQGPVAGVEVEAALEITGDAPRDVIEAQRRVLHGLARAERIAPAGREDLRQAAAPIWIALDGWKQVSDERGLAVWRSLPAGRWRWRLFTQRSFTITPPFERAEIEFDGRLAQANQVPRDTSGAFELAAGVTLRLECRAAGDCVLRGVIAFEDRSPAPDVRVLLRRVEKHIDPLGLAAPIEDSKIVGEMGSAADGAFEFVHLEPGRFDLTAVHADAQQRFDFAHAHAELAAGEARDLGVVTLGGAGLAGRIDFVDAASRRVLEPATVAAQASERPRVTLAWVAPAAYEVLSIAVGVPFEIHGLEPGRYYASIDADTSDWGLDGAYTVAGELPSITFDAPGFDAPLDFAIPLTKLARLRLRGRVGEPSRNPWSVHGKLRATEGAGAADFSCVPQEVEIDTEVSVPPGDYWLCAQAATFEGARAVAWQRVTVPPEGGECVLGFQLAVELSGVAVSSDTGAALDGKLVFAAPIDAPRDAWFFDARANERGEFTLDALPANARIRFKDSADLVDTRAAGVTGAVVRFDSRPRR